jgi:hypothetical protein
MVAKLSILGLATAMVFGAGALDTLYKVSIGSVLCTSQSQDFRNAQCQTNLPVTCTTVTSAVCDPNNDHLIDCTCI